MYSKIFQIFNELSGGSGIVMFGSRRPGRAGAIEEKLINQ